MSFSPEKSVLTIDPDKFPLIDRCMAQRGVNLGKYKYEVHTLMKIINKEVNDLVSENTSATSIECESSIETSSATSIEFRSSVETLSATPSTSIEALSATPIAFRSNIETSSTAPIEFGSSIETSPATSIESRPSIETSSATSSTSIDYDQIFHDLFRKFAFEEMKGDIPCYIMSKNSQESIQCIF